MKFVLDKLALNGVEVPLRRAWVEWKHHGGRVTWGGFVEGLGDVTLPTLVDLDLNGETTEGRRVVGRVVVPSEHLGRDSFDLQGIDVLLIDGHEPMD